MWNDESRSLNEAYDWVEFTLATGQTNYDVKTNQATLFNNVPRARTCVIWTTKDITARFNNTAYPAVKIDAMETPAEPVRMLDIKNIYITNASGSTSTIRILLIL